MIMACPCDLIVQPQIIFNSPGLDSIDYRVGDYLAFRQALLRSLPGEVELTAWRPSAQGDLAVQMMEWWAYLADILTFYNERIANQDYLRTADLPESVQRLIRVLGYRPRPGIGARGTLAALLTGPKAITLPQGFQIQSKPGPGKEPQIFELGAPTLIQPADAFAAVPTPDPALFGVDGSVLLAGTVSSVKAGEEVLLLRKDWAGTTEDYAVAVVQSLSQEKDPGGKATSRVTFTKPLSLTGNAADFRLLRSTQSAHVWQYPARVITSVFPFVISDPFVIQQRQVDLESIAREIRVTDPLLFVGSDLTPSRQLVSVTSYTEAVWYANAKGTYPYAESNDYDPTIPLAGGIPIPIPHSRIGFKGDLKGFTDSDDQRKSTIIRHGWQDVGTLIASPAKTLSAGAWLTANPINPFPALNSTPLLIEDAIGDGEAAIGTTSTDQSTLQLTGLPSPPPALVSPLNVLLNLLSVTRGKTVTNEILGSGDATIAGQEFVLKNSPLTYLLSADSASGSGYTSTLQVWINGVQWKEVPNFYGQDPAALIFVTREDEQNTTHVQFGDGINGARLPSGVNNVVATYRYGSGAEAPDAGSLTVILQPQPGLKAIRNPVPAGGGADPDPPQKIKRYAPQSVLTLGRAVSADDYETIAAQTPGVARAKAYWTWDPIQQRSLVKIYVGDDDNAVSAARTALAAADDPNRPVQISQASGLIAVLSLTLVVDPNYVTAAVVNAATAVLLDPDTGLFGANVIGVGQRIYESQIYQACLDVPGAVAVHNLRFSFLPPAVFISKAFPSPIFQSAPFLFEAPFRFDPGEGGFFQLVAANLTISPEGASNAG
jgi:hypothetical protein